MNRTAWIVIGALCILGLGGLVYMAKKDTVAVDVESVNPATITASSDSTIGDHVYGNKDAKVVLFEYADFQCPACGSAYPNTKTIKSYYKDSVAFVFRNLPLVTIHPNAMSAAAAAETAGLQGKYWEMYDLLFENRSSWVNLSADTRGSMFESYATQIGLNLDQYRSDLSSKKVMAKIQFDMAIAAKLKVAATPSFFIGDAKVDDTVSNDTFQKQGTLLMDKLDEALKNAGVTPPTRS